MTPSSSSTRNFALKDSTLTTIRGYFKGPEAQTKAEKLIPILTEIVSRILEDLTEKTDTSIKEEELKGAIPSFKTGCDMIVQDIKERGIRVEGGLKWDDEIKLQSEPLQVFKIQKIT